MLESSEYNSEILSKYLAVDLFVINNWGNSLHSLGRMYVKSVICFWGPYFSRLEMHIITALRICPYAEWKS